MQYLLLIYSPESHWDSVPEPRDSRFDPMEPQ